MIRTKEELMTLIKEYIGDDTSDKALEIVEDTSDTIDDLSTGDGEDWKSKYDELDKTWREKYKSRFFESTEKEKQEDNEEVEEDEIKKNYKYEDLFKEEEKK